MSSTKTRPRRALIAAAAGLAFLGVLLGLFLGIGRWLQYEEPPQPADLIVVLAGSPERAIKGAALYRHGFAPEIWTSRPIRERALADLDAIGISLPREEEITRRVLLKSGVPDSRIHLYCRDALSTVEEALCLREALGNRSVKILLVSHRTHLRRAKMVFQDALPAARIVVVASDSQGPKTKWWTDKSLAGRIVDEFVRILYYETGGRFLTRHHL